MKLHVNGTELFFDVAGSELDAAADFRQKPTMNAQLHVFEHSGHMVFMEEQEELVSVIKLWIESL